MIELKLSILEAIASAVKNLESANMSVARSASTPNSYTDKRKPIVIDEDMRALMFRRQDDSVIGTLVNFIIHVE